MAFADLSKLLHDTFGASFQYIVEFTSVDEIADAKGHYRIRYEEHLPDTWMGIQRGIYAVVINNRDPVYIGAFTRSVRKRWFNTRERYLYHFKREKIADSLAKGEKVSLFMLSEQALREQAPANLKEFITVEGIEAALLQRTDAECFVWNKRGRR